MFMHEDDDIHPGLPRFCLLVALQSLMASALFHSQKCHDLDDELYAHPCKKEHGSVAEME